MITHLSRRGSRYYIRRRIPADLLGFYKKTEIQRALGTSERREAERLVRVFGAALDKEFEEARRKLSTLPVEAPAPAPVAPSASNKPLELYSSREEMEYWEEVGERQIQESFAEEEADEAADRLILALRRAGRDLPQYQAPAPTYATEDFPEKATGPANGLTLDSLVTKWAEERTPDKRTIGIMRRAVRVFRELVGGYIPTKIETKHIVAFKDALLKSGQTPVNTNHYLTNLSTLLNYAAANLLIPHNPARGIKVQLSKRARESRRPWSVDELNRLLAGPVHAKGERPGAGAGEASYWLPLLGLFTGARLEELAQLRPEDVREASYIDTDGEHARVWVIDITDAGEGQEVKTSSSRRTVPIHAELLKLGFIDFAKAAQQEHRPRLFHKLIPDSMGVESGNWSKWFGKYKRSLGISDPTVVFHSLRHTWKAQARAVGIEEEVSDAITGHSGGGVGRTYGGAYPLRPLVDAMSHYCVLGLKLGS